MDIELSNERYTHGINAEYITKYTKVEGGRFIKVRPHKYHVPAVLPGEIPDMWPLLICGRYWK